VLSATTHVSRVKNAQGCQGGIRRILKVDTLCYHFQQKIAYIPNLTVMPNPRSNLLDYHLFLSILFYRCSSVCCPVANSLSTDRGKK